MAAADKFRTAARKLRKILARYDVIEQQRAGARTATAVETGSEESTELTNRDRLTAIAICRDLERNSAAAIANIEQRKVMVAGTVRIQLNTDSDEWNAAASEWFNTIFSKDCFYRYPMSFSEFVMLVEASKIREGDVLVAFDSKITGSGKLLAWESDQLVQIRPADWDAQTKYRGIKPGAEEDGPLPFPQENGVIMDWLGKELAYVVGWRNFADDAGHRGQITLPADQCLIIPVEDARLVRRVFRLNQRRGIGLLLPVADCVSDANDMVKAEVATAKIYSQRGVWIKHSAEKAQADQFAEVDQLLEQLENEGLPEDDAGESENTAAPVRELKKYRLIEKHNNGYIEYLDEGDEVIEQGGNRPNLNVAQFSKDLSDRCAAVFGLAQGYGRMAVSASYTAHRGESMMTWRHIRAAQKQHERQWLDWAGAAAIRHAITTGILPEGPDGWEKKIGWEFPKSDAIDPVKEETATALALKNGTTDFRRLLGPRWRERLQELADQLAAAREMGLPLNVFETVSGMIAEVDSEDSQDNETESKEE